MEYEDLSAYNHSLLMEKVTAAWESDRWELVCVTYDPVTRLWYAALRRPKVLPTASRWPVT